MRFLLLILLIPAALGASHDPLVADLSRPLSEGNWDVSIGLRQYARDLWDNGQGTQVYYQGKYTGIMDADGAPKSVKGFGFEFRGLWQATGRSLVSLVLPYDYQEFSLDQAANTVPYSLTDSSVHRGDGIGDIRLGLRQVLLAFSHGRLGANLDFSAPTGLGPFSSSHPFVATGSGSFGGSAALEAEAEFGDWGLWLQGRMPFDFGSNVTIGPEVFEGFESDNTTPVFYPQGNAFVRRDPGIEADLGISWIWAESAAYQHRLMIEAVAKNEGGLRINGKRLDDTIQQSLLLVPEAGFHYINGINFILGWELQPLWATHQPVAYWGEFLLRADYSL